MIHNTKLRLVAILVTACVCSIPAHAVELIGVHAEEKKPTVAILLFDHAEIIDFAGPWEVFGGAGYKVFTVAEKTDPINAVFGQKITADYTFENSPRADVLLVPGGGVRDATNNPKLIKWVQENARDSQYDDASVYSRH